MPPRLGKADWYSTPDARRDRPRLCVTMSPEVRALVRGQAQAAGEPVGWVVERLLRRALKLPALSRRELSGPGFRAKGKGKGKKTV